jgi:hypothetical protein
VRELAICTAGLLAALGAVTCKPTVPSESHRGSVRPPPLEMPAYGVCPPNAVNCDPERLRMLQDSLAALQKRHRSRDSLRTPPPQNQNRWDWRFYLLGELGTRTGQGGLDESTR